MGSTTEISWTDSTWNPVVGCTKVSTGCKFCYAERVSKRMGKEFTQVTPHPERLDQPLRWKKPRRIFVNSMSDLFHESISEDFIFLVFQTMGGAFHHTYQILTKRAERMLDVIPRISQRLDAEGRSPLGPVWKHVHLGVSCENQEQADQRIPLLLQTPAAVRFVSLEPLLSAIDISPYLDPLSHLDGTYRRLIRDGMFNTYQVDSLRRPIVRWVIVGGESGGPPERALVEYNGLGEYRVKDDALAWVRSIRDQCQQAGVALHLKQWGGPRPKSGGRILDGRTWDEYPS